LALASADDAPELSLDGAAIQEISGRIGRALLERGYQRGAGS
jgi:hypothetical protein